MSEGLATLDAVTSTRRMLALRASLFALVAGVLVALSLTMGTATSPALRTFLAVAAVAAPVAVLFASRSFLMLRGASALLVLLVALFALTPFVSRGTDALAFAEAFAMFRPWPLIVAAFAAGRALDDLSSLAETHPSRDPAWSGLVVASGDVERIARSLTSTGAYTIGVTVLILCLAFAAAEFFGSVTDAEWLVKTLVHIGLVMLAALCGVLIIAALSERPAPPLAVSSPLSEAFGFAAAGRRRYLRTLIALLPVLGFVGTVLGIQSALSRLPEDFSASFGEAGPDIAFTTSLSGIATAFETTLIGLVASFVFQFVLAGIERAESARLVDRLVDHAKA